MKVSELIKILSELPSDTKIEIFASEADGEMAIDLIEYYEPGKGNTVMLMDRKCEPMEAAKVLLDRRDEYEEP